MRIADFTRVLSTVGIICLFFSVIFIPPIIISEIYQDGVTQSFVEAMSITVLVGIALWLPFRKNHTDLHRRDGFLIIVLVWLILSLLASLPFDFILHTSIVDSLFEAVSGITTTGATVFTNLDKMAPSLLFYRQELQWFGGMGLIVLAVAVIPQLGIGGMSIYKAEVPGVMKEEKLTPRLSQTASILWKMYLGLTLLCAFAYWFAGMSFYDALAHSMTTVSTGGFSTHDLSLSYFDSVLIEQIAVVFMVLGAINFSLHFQMIRQSSFNIYSMKKNVLRVYFDDEEVRLFLLIILLSVILITVTLVMQYTYPNATTSLRHSVFTVVSMITSTGFVTADYSKWTLFIPFFLIIIGFVGGCGGSTAGGMKVIRILILLKLVYREFKQMMHPKGVFLIKIAGSNIIANRTLQSVFGFFVLYITSFSVMLLLMMLDGADQVTAFSAIATCMNNMGPGLGEVSQSFAGLKDFEKLVSVAAMLLGRLEVVSVLVLMSPEYWRE
jgi:trk system potassium uptake protein TrkH